MLGAATSNPQQNCHAPAPMPSQLETEAKEASVLLQQAAGRRQRTCTPPTTGGAASSGRSRRRSRPCTAQWSMAALMTTALLTRSSSGPATGREGTCEQQEQGAGAAGCAWETEAAEWCLRDRSCQCIGN